MSLSRILKFVFGSKIIKNRWKPDLDLDLLDPFHFSSWIRIKMIWIHISAYNIYNFCPRILSQVERQKLKTSVVDLAIIEQVSFFPSAYNFFYL